MTNAINELAADVVAALADSGKTLSTAESCTGGWIAKAITDIPGSSAVFGLGLVTYSNGAKMAQLQVPLSELEMHGAVSEAVVLSMATGARATSGADIAVSVSGVAGPDGGSADKPVGTVWFAWSSQDAVDAELQHFNGDRQQVRESAVRHALQGVLARA